MKQGYSDWDYVQADLQSWEAEPDKERLSEALSLSSTEPEHAFSLLYRLAKEGSPIAMNALGENYCWGVVVPVDRIEAERWFERAFDRGSLRGMLNYGKALVRRGEFSWAETVFSVGAAQDWGPALYWLASVEYRRSEGRSLARIRPLLERAVELGSPAAKMLLGNLMMLGRYGLRQVPRGWRLAHGAAQVLPGDARRKRTKTVSGETIH